jgi:15-cis-phytoene synthase
MQLTNIVRDVGDDLRGGRLYLPRELLARHGVSETQLKDALAGRRPVGPAYRALLEELMAAADADYQRAFLAIPALPHFFQRPVAVAARLYQGIHGAVRRNGYDNLRRRAYTSVGAKAVLGGRAILELRAVAAR